MAFYNRNIAKNKTLRKAWRAGHQIKLDENEEICLPEICGEIARWMRRDRAPRNRLSLRSFSVLLCGAIRLYRDEVSNLLSDTFNFNWTKRQTSPLSILHTVDRAILPSDFSENSEEESFVLMPKTIHLTEVTENNYEEIDTSSAESSQGDDSDDEEGLSDEESTTFTDESTVFNDELTVFNDELTVFSDESTVFTDESTVFTDASTVFTVPPADKQLIANPIETRDQCFQTSPCVETERTRGFPEGFDPNLPFGYIIVHDNYHSRIPSKILFSSLNENVKYY